MKLHTAPKNLFLTGLPGCGKTTVIRRVMEGLRGWRLAGFSTDEIRDSGNRVGFLAAGLGGATTTLAHVKFPGKHRVGRYGVNVGEFEAIVREELGKPAGTVDLFIVDEIGKMECMSPIFIESVRRILDGPVPVLATIAAQGGGFISQVKTRPEIELITVSSGNRDQLAGDLVPRLRLLITSPEG